MARKNLGALKVNILALQTCGEQNAWRYLNPLCSKEKPLKLSNSHIKTKLAESLASRCRCTALSPRYLPGPRIFTVLKANRFSAPYWHPHPRTATQNQQSFSAGLHPRSMRLALPPLFTLSKQFETGSRIRRY